MTRARASNSRSRMDGVRCLCLILFFFYFYSVDSWIFAKARTPSHRIVENRNLIPFFVLFKLKLVVEWGKKRKASFQVRGKDQCFISPLILKQVTIFVAHYFCLETIRFGFGPFWKLGACNILAIDWGLLRVAVMEPCFRPTSRHSFLLRWQPSSMYQLSWKKNEMSITWCIDLEGRSQLKRPKKGKGQMTGAEALNEPALPRSSPRERERKDVKNISLKYFWQKEFIFIVFIFLWLPAHNIFWLPSR